MVSDRYLATTGVQRMAEHLRMLQRLDDTPVVTELFHHPDLGSSDLVVVTRDLPGLFSLIAGTLASQGVNIMSAQIHTRGDGIAIDTFQVNDPTGEAVTSPATWAPHARRAAVGADGRGTGGGPAREAAGRRPRAAAGAGGPAKITLDNQLSDDYTVLEVKCPDRLGLLYLVTRTLAALGLDIATRADRDRDRPGGRHVLRARRPGPEDRGCRRARAGSRGARAGARPAPLTMLGRYREPVRTGSSRSGSRSIGGCACARIT